MPASFVFFVLSLGSLSGANLKKRSSAEMLLLRSGLHKRSAQAVFRAVLMTQGGVVGCISKI